MNINLYEDVYIIIIFTCIFIGIIKILGKDKKPKKQNNQDCEEEFKNNIIKILEIIKKEKGDIKKELDILSDLADLKMKEYNPKHDEICVICLENLRNDTTMKNCNHSFHISCLKNWHKTNRSCPICRK